MMAAVAATLASTQFAAVTVAVRHHGAAGRPVRGSTMWCRTTSPRFQRRTVVLDVASPPVRMLTVCPGASMGLAWSSVTRIGQPPRRWGSGDGDVTTEANEHASVRAGAGRLPADTNRSVNGESLGGRAQIELDPLGDPDGAPCPVDGHQLPSRYRPGGQAQWRAVRVDGSEIPVVAEEADGRADGGVDHPGGEAGAAEGRRRPRR